MRTQKRAVSGVIIAAVVIVIIAAAVAEYALSTSSRTSTMVVTSTVPTTVTFTLATTVTASVTSSRGVAPLLSFSADAYSTEVTALLNGFSSSTGVPVAPVTSGGSFADANQIAAGAPDDVFVSVSLSAASPAYLKNLSSNWAVGFASDQMVLAYANASASQPAVANVINQGNQAAKSNATSDWNAFFSSLVSGNVKIGISNPVSDPAGLRGWLVLEAAGHLYAGGGNESAYTAPLLQDKANVTGTNAAALVSPLQSGQIQFLFIYKSAAIGQHLSYLVLDRHVNLSDPTLGKYYSQLAYKDSAGVTAGAAIVLCVTIPLSSVNTAEALQFVQYVVKNAPSLSTYGLQPFSPARLYNSTVPPQPITQLVSQGVIVGAGALP